MYTAKFPKPLTHRTVREARHFMNAGPIASTSALGPTHRDAAFYLAGEYMGRRAANEALPEVPAELMCPLTTDERFESKFPEGPVLMLDPIAIVIKPSKEVVVPMSARAYP